MKNALIFGLCRRWAWALVPVFAITLTFFAGRGWPFHVGPGFPKSRPGMGRPSATQATLFVYSPDARTMRLEVKLLTEGLPAELHVAVANGKLLNAAAVRPSAAAGGCRASAPLRLERGDNAVNLSLRTPGSAEPMAFFVESARVTQRLFTVRNLMFSLAAVSVVCAAILAARGVGARGLEGFCAALPIGFLLITGTATVLSYAHGLTAGRWTGAIVGASVLVSAAAVRWGKPGSARVLLAPVEAAVLLAITLPVFLMQILSPIDGWDDLMYHGPRAAYWMEKASALPFVSHNDRLSVFPMGGDLMFACGTIITGAELPGKLMVFLAYPFTLFMMLALLRSAGVRSWLSLLSAVIFGATPIVYANARGIKPDLWLVLMSLVTLHWILVARRGHPTISTRAVCCLAAAGAGAAMGIKWTAAPLLLLFPFLLLRRVEDWRERLPPAFFSAVAALALGGAGPILLSNGLATHHPFGPATMRAVHQPAAGWHAVAVQLKRLPFILAKPPMAPGEAARAALENAAKGAADWLGAAEPLREEVGRVWPGPFAPRVQMTDDGFALAWLLVAAGAVFALLRRPVDRTAWLIFGVGLTLAGAVVTQTRWQAAAGLPDRFLLPALALGLVAAALSMERALPVRKTPLALLGGLAGYHLLPLLVAAPLAFRFGAIGGWQAPASWETTSEYDRISHLLPPGRTILLISGQGSRDYPLFDPREGFANRVVPWGKQEYESAAFERALNQPRVDTVVLFSAGRIEMLWDPPIDAQPFIDDLQARPDFVRAPDTGPLAVFLRKP